VLTVRHPTSYTYVDQRNGRCYLIYYVHRELPIWSLVGPLMWKATPDFAQSLHALVVDARDNDHRLAPFWPRNMCDIPETYVHEGEVKACVYHEDMENPDGTPKVKLEALYSNAEYRVKVYIGQKIGNWVDGMGLCARGYVKAGKQKNKRHM
jgi:hypothetical protein